MQPAPDFFIALSGFNLEKRRRFCGKGAGEAFYLIWPPHARPLQKRYKDFIPSRMGLFLWEGKQVFLRGTHQGGDRRAWIPGLQEGTKSRRWHMLRLRVRAGGKSQPHSRRCGCSDKTPARRALAGVIGCLFILLQAPARYRLRYRQYFRTRPKNGSGPA